MGAINNTGRTIADNETIAISHNLLERLDIDDLEIVETDGQLVIRRISDNEAEKEVDSPVWQGDPYFWEFFIPDEIRKTWPQLDDAVKAAVHATAKKANEHLKDCGVFDY